MGPNQINQIVQMLGMVNNPEQFLQNAIKNNPQMAQIMKQVQNSGMGATGFLEQYAKQNNIDLTPIKDMLNKRGVKF